MTGHLFDIETGELRGHASWRWVDEQPLAEPTIEGGDPVSSDEDAAAAAIAILVVVGIVAATIAATPALRRWWNRRIRPFAASPWRKLVGSLPRREPITAAEVQEIAAESVRAPAVDEELQAIGPRFTMSSAEWTARFRAMLAANDVVHEQLRTLAHAQVLDDDAELPEIGRNENLTALQFAERLRLALKSTPIALDDQTSTVLMRTFGAPIELAQTGARRQLE